MNVLLRVLILVIAFFASSEAFAQYRVIVGIGSNNSTSGQMQPGSRINDVAWTATSRVININNNVGATVTVYFADGRAARFAVSQTGTLIPLTDSKPDSEFDSPWDSFLNWVGERLRELVDNTDYNGDGDTADEIEYTFIEYEMSSCGSSVPEYDAC